MGCKAKGIIENMWWGRPPNKRDGKTIGCICGYCNRIFTSREQSRGISLTDWEGELGASPEALDHHQELVQLTVTAIIASGADRRCHLNWDKVEEGRLRKVESKEVKVKHPGWKHYSMPEYEKEFGELENNLDKGHKKWTIANKPGVLVPARDIRTIEHNDIIAAQVVTDLDVGQGLGLIDAKDLHRNIDNFQNRSLSDITGTGVPHTPQRQGSPAHKGNTQEPSPSGGVRNSPGDAGINEFRGFMDSLFC